MGACHSSQASCLREETETNIVYVGEQEVSVGSRRVASLCSKQGRKGYNQDTAILREGFEGEDGIFCGVFDGHGRHGHEVSALVRDYLPTLLLSQRSSLLIADEDDDGDTESSIYSEEDYSDSSPELFDEWKEACIAAFKAMDRKIIHHPTIDCSVSGSTAVTVIKQGRDLIIANLGDSRAVLGTKSGTGELVAVQLTTDLKPNIPHEAERIKKKHGRIFALREEPNIQRVWVPNHNYPGLAMARAFGDLEVKSYGVIAIPQVFYHCLDPNDQFIVLASDGVWDVLTNKEVVSLVGSTRKVKAAEAVVTAAYRAWRRKFSSLKIDDCTALCLFFEDMDEEGNVAGNR